MPTSHQLHVVVIGGGFAGLEATKRLARDARVRTTLIDRRNHHLFQPLLYQVATAGLTPSDIAVPIRSQFARCRNVDVILADIEAIDLERKVLQLENRELAYDAIVIATGAGHSYFGHDEWEPWAPGLKTLEQATDIRRRILLAFELAETELDEHVQRELLTFVVVGGGPTGVELAGAIADISRNVLRRDFRAIDPRSARILLVEAGPRLLTTFPEELSERARADLESLGVDVLLGSLVEEIDERGVVVGGGRGAADAVSDQASRRIHAATVIWAAGVQASSLAGRLGVACDRNGRIKVQSDLTVPGHDDAYVAGDVAHVELEGGGTAPGLAPAAIQMGRRVAENILATLDRKPRRPFHYVDKGTMATIGKRKAIAVAGGLRLGGTVAWVAWLFIHILYLVGFKNRVSVFFEWCWAYAFSKRGARLILQPKPTEPPRDPQARDRATL